MSDFQAKMHQNRFRLGLRPRPRWGSSQRSPRPPSWIKGGQRLREIWEGRGRGGKGGEDRGKRGREAEGTGREGTPPIFYCTPSSNFLEICLAITRRSVLQKLQNNSSRGRQRTKQKVMMYLNSNLLLRQQARFRNEQHSQA